MENVQKANQCEPDQPAPQQTEKDMCEGTIRIECCCPKLMTRTFWIRLGPQTREQFDAFVDGSIAAYEGNGYLIMAHSVVDVGDGWRFGFTVGWYQ